MAKKSIKGKSSGGSWITINGRHIQIGKGESKKDAIDRLSNQLKGLNKTQKKVNKGVSDKKKLNDLSNSLKNLSKTSKTLTKKVNAKKNKGKRKIRAHNLGDVRSKMRGDKLDYLFQKVKKSKSKK